MKIENIEGAILQTFKSVRTVQYTEVVEVQADTVGEARDLAAEADGERNHDDVVVSLELSVK